MEQRRVSGIKIAMVYIGTVVGAGFATGQEILQFFVRFGIGGLWGILLSTVLFALYGVLIMRLGMALSARSHLEVIQGIGGAGFGVLIDALIMLSLFGAVTAMLAGSGALFAQQFGVPAALGSAVMAVLTAVTVMRGLHGVINAISAVVPFLLVSVIGISVYALMNAPPDLQGVPVSGGGLMGNWLWAAILYSSYNILMSASILAPLGGAVSDRRQVFRGGALGGIGLGAASLLIYLALSASSAETRGLAVPLLHIAGRIGPLAGALFSAVLLAEIYTTAVGSLYGFSARLAGQGGTRGGASPTGMPIKIIVATVLAFLASLLGFTNLVRTLYPLQGYGGIVFLLAILYATLRQTRSAPK